MVKRRRFVSKFNGAVDEEVTKKRKAFDPEPDWSCKEKSKAGAVTKKVEFVELSGAAERGVYVVGLDTRSFIEQFLREYILGNEYKGSDEGAQDSKEVARELNATSKDNTKSKRDQGEIGGSRIVYVKEEPIREDGEERGQALDGVDEGDRNLGGCCGGEEVTTDLKES